MKKLINKTYTQEFFQDKKKGKFFTDQDSLNPIQQVFNTVNPDK